jgi:hypothetical protein
METWNLLISKGILPKRLSFTKLILVGAEGFEPPFGWARLLGDGSSFSRPERCTDSVERCGGFCAVTCSK